MSDCPCTSCTRPRHVGWSICKACAGELEQVIAEVPALTAELAITLSRQNAKGGAGNVSGTTERPLPFDARSSEAAWVLRNTLTSWVRALEDDRARQPIDTMPAMSDWLLTHYGRVLVHPAAEQAVDELTAAAGNAWATIDNPAERVFLGRCPACGLGDVYAALGSLNTGCRVCGAVHDVAALRTALRASLDDQLVTATEYAGMLTILGIHVDRDRTRTLVNVWASRGRIVTHAGPTYRFGELQARMDERRAI